VLAETAGGDITETGLVDAQPTAEAGTETAEVGAETTGAASTSGSAETVTSGGDGASDQGGSDTDGKGAIPSVLAVPAAVLFDRYAEAVGALGDPGRLATVFLRHGYFGNFAADLGLFKSINLSLLESMPLLGALAAGPVLAWRRLRAGGRGWRGRPVAVTDAFVLVLTVLWVGLYLGRLPLHHQYTVRYLHPLYVVGLYLLVRAGPVRTALATRPRVAVSAYLATVVAGTALYLVALGLLRPVLSEVVQLYGVVAAVLGLGVAGWGVVAAVRGVDRRVGAGVVGVAAGAVTVYLLVGGFVAFAYTDNYLLPLGRTVAEALGSVNPFGFVL
jgi:hypothetical protein